MLAWDDLQFFLAVAERGSLSAAAKQLKVTQPTVGRRIAAFERQLGAELFLRSSTGLHLTPTGRSLVANAEAMREHALRAESIASGRDVGVSGKVRLTASEWLIESVLAPSVGTLLAQYPALELELVSEARHVNLARRDADLALRPSPFQHESVYQRSVGEVAFALYASDKYFAQHGFPNFAAGAAGHALIEMSEELHNVVDREWLPQFAAGARIVARCNGRRAMASLAVSGAGFTCLPCLLGDATPGLRRLVTPTTPPLRKLWLGVHRSARRTPRVRVTLAFLTQHLTQLSSALNPRSG